MRVVALAGKILLIIPLWYGCLSAAAVNRPAGLQDHVTIYRDTYGVPHILGDTEEATFFGYGYAQAEDHLEKMMIQYRDAQGRRSEVLGDSALGGDMKYNSSDYRWDGDYLQRLLRTSAAVEENRQKMDPRVSCLLAAFADGINWFIDTHRRAVPAWIDRVSAEDIEALERSIYLRYYSIDDALSKLEANHLPPAGLGSNQWAIAPWKSARGYIFHVEHMHLPWSNQLQVYEAHLITPGKLNAAGIGWFGSPFFISGFNSRITWSATYNRPNLSDIYEEQLNPANSTEYLYEGAWQKMRETSASFRVLQADKSWKIVVLPMYYTRHGPVVRIDPRRHKAYAAKVPQYEGVNYSSGMYSLMKAADVEGFKDALAKQLIPRWNFLCTDRRDMYWVHNAVVPRRNPDYNWRKPVPGWLRDTEWSGYLPFSANPQLRNPASGFIQNSNNPPWLSTRGSRIGAQDPTTYYLLGPVVDVGTEQQLNRRGERLFGVLTRPKERFTLDQMIRLAFDTYILPADTIVPLLVNAAARHPEESELQAVVEQLRRWNRRALKDSVAYTYVFFWQRAYRSLFPDLAARFSEYDRYQIDRNSSREQDRAWEALQAAVLHVRNTFGRTDVPWGSINRVIRGESLPLDGTAEFDVLHPDGGVEQPNGEIHCDDGWGHLMVVEEGPAKRIWSLLPYGESEHSDSPHYNDQAKLHSNQKLKPFWFTRTEIQQNTESTWGDPGRIARAEF